jgi:hypothetical protein
MRQISLSLVRRLSALCLAGVLGMTAKAEEGGHPGLTEIISKVRENVESLRERLPDFVCKEDLSVRESDNDKTIEEKHFLVSLQVIRQTHDSANRFSESRDVIAATINGKTVGPHKYAPPVHWIRGGFVRDIFTLFDETAFRCYDFTPADTSGMTESNTLVLSASIRKAQSPDADCTHLPAELSSARIWIDLKAFQVVRIEEGAMHETQFSTPFAHSNGEYTYAPVIEYSPVRIHDVDYWLPRFKRADFIKSNGRHSFSYMSQYSDYHKFETSITIRTVSEVN